MATALTHVLPRSVEDWEEEDRRTIRYGRCTTEAYAANGLWFVSFRKRPISGPELTYLVSARYATPHFFNQVGFDIDMWENIAHFQFEGDWNEEYECMWYDTPYSTHQLPDGSRVYFGKSRMRSHKRPNKQLWWLVLGQYAYTSPGSRYGEIHFGEFHLIDEACIQPDFIDQMGTEDGGNGWGRISWKHFSADPRNCKGLFDDDNWVPDPYEIIRRRQDEGKPWWRKLLRL